MAKYTANHSKAHAVLEKARYNLRLRKEPSLIPMNKLEIAHKQVQKYRVLNKFIMITAAISVICNIYLLLRH